MIRRPDKNLYMITPTMAETHLQSCNQCNICGTYLDNEELVYWEYGLLCDVCLSEINSDDGTIDALEEETLLSIDMNKDILNMLNIITKKCEINSL